jgi:hypothetical protein
MIEAFEFLQLFVAAELGFLNSRFHEADCLAGAGPRCRFTLKCGDGLAATINLPRRRSRAARPVRPLREYAWALSLRASSGTEGCVHGALRTKSL